MIRYLFILLLLIAYSGFSQTFTWNGTYGGAGASRTYTGAPVSGITMSATIVNSENVFQDASPRFLAAGGVATGSGCAGLPAANAGVLLSTNWTTNTTKTITLTISFSAPVRGPVNFSLYDINDDGFGSWEDRIIISGTNHLGAAVNCSRVGTFCIQTGGSFTGNNTPTLTLNSGQSSACTCFGNNSINVGGAGDCVSTVTIQYRSNVVPASFNNPQQYVVVSNLTATVDPTCTVLPVELYQFGGECRDGVTQLDWATASELNNDYFDLEQGEDGVNFEKVVQVRGSGTVNTSSFYSSRATVEKGKYFRLKQVDYDGQYSYSNIIHVGCGEEEPIIYPNPFEDNLTIKLNDFYSKNYSIAIKDMNGHVVKYLEFFDQNVKPNVVLDLAELAKGLYIIEIINLNDQSVIKKSKLSKI